MVGHRAPWPRGAEGYGLKVLRRDTGEYEVRDCEEAEPPVVVRFTQHHTAAGTTGAKYTQRLAHQPRADAAALLSRDDREGTEPEPAGCTVRDRYRGYRNVTQEDALRLGDQRHRQGSGS